MCLTLFYVAFSCPSSLCMQTCNAVSYLFPYSHFLQFLLRLQQKIMKEAQKRELLKAEVETCGNQIKCLILQLVCFCTLYFSREPLVFRVERAVLSCLGKLFFI